MKTNSKVNITREQAEKAAEWIIDNFYGKNVLQKKFPASVSGRPIFSVYQFKVKKNIIVNAYLRGHSAHGEDGLPVIPEKDISVTVMKFKENGYVRDPFETVMAKGDGKDVRIDLASIYNPELPKGYLSMFNESWYEAASENNKLVNFCVLDGDSFSDIRDLIMNFFKYDELRKNTVNALLSRFNKLGLHDE